MLSLAESATKERSCAGPIALSFFWAVQRGLKIQLKARPSDSPGLILGLQGLLQVALYLEVIKKFKNRQLVCKSVFIYTLAPKDLIVGC